MSQIRAQTHPDLKQPFTFAPVDKRTRDRSASLSACANHYAITVANIISDTPYDVGDRNGPMFTKLAELQEKTYDLKKLYRLA